MINITQNIATNHHLEHNLEANISCFQIKYYDDGGVWQQTRHIGWTEDNRITNVIDKSYHSYYSYDDGGERVLKFTGPSNIIDVNAEFLTYQSDLKNITLYTSPYLVAHNKGYTKHFYAGSERVCAAIGEGGLNSQTTCIGQNSTLQNKATNLFNNTMGSMHDRNLLDNTECLNNGKDVDLEEVVTRMVINSSIDGSTFRSTLNKYCSQNNANSAVYYYHSDHLGSASWITNKTGTPVQHLQYMPYGEPLVNERTGSYEERFTFTGKERDSETGFSYFGARYYDSDILTGWLSVDPMADKYPSLSPYAYCAWNPIKLVDPDGEFPIGVHKETVIIAFLGSNLDSHAKDKIIYGAGIHSDVLHAPFSSIHLDNLSGFDNIKGRYLKTMADYNNNFMNCDYIAAGMNLHTIADFYAHSNYIDLYSKYASVNDDEINIEKIPTFFKAMEDDNFREFVNANGGLHTGTFSISGWLSEKLFNIPPKEGSHSLVNLDDEFSPNGKQPYSNKADKPTKYAVARALAQREINNLVNGENQ